MRDLAISLIIVAILPLTFRSATSAILLWAWSAYVDLDSVVYGFLASVPLQKVIVFFTVISLVVSKTKRRFYVDRTIVLMFLFLVFSFMSQYYTVAASSDGWDLYDKVVKIYIFAFIITGVMWERLQVHALVIAICLALGFNGVWEGVLFFLTGGAHVMEGTPSLGDNNQFALLMAMAIPLFYYVYEQSSRRPVRLASLIACFLVAASVIGSRSRGGFAGLIVIGLALSLFSRRKLLATAITLVVGVGLVAFAPDSWTARMNTIQTANQDDSFMGRVIAWKLSTLIALDHPLLGGGFHAVQHQNVWDHYTQQFDTLSVIPTDPPDIYPHAAHSLYFELLGDTGFVGLGLFLLMIATAFGNARAIQRLARGRPELAWAGSLAGKILVSLAVLLVSGAVLSTAYYELPYMLMAILSVTRRQLQAPAQETEPRAARAGLRRWGAGIAARPAARPAAPRAGDPAPVPAVRPSAATPAPATAAARRPPAAARSPVEGRADRSRPAPDQRPP